MVKKKIKGTEKREIEELKKELAKTKEKMEEYLSGWKRTLADFDNFKKTQAKEREEFIKLANKGLILDILPILDNFGIAWKSLPKELKGDSWVEGIGHIKKSLENLLKEKGVEEIDPKGEEFDPAFHEAVEKVKGPRSKNKKIKVIEVVQKGYKLNGEVIRPARVKVG